MACAPDELASFLGWIRGDDRRQRLTYPPDLVSQIRQNTSSGASVSIGFSGFSTVKSHPNCRCVCVYPALYITKATGTLVSSSVLPQTPDGDAGVTMKIRSCQGLGHRIVECLASTVINKSKAGSDSNLCTVESRHISAHRRLERCSSRIWQVCVVEHAHVQE